MLVVVCCLSRVVGWLVVKVLLLRSRILASCLLLLPSPRSLREPWNPVSEWGGSAGKPRPFPQNPVRAVERTTRAARGTSSQTTPEELGVAVAKEGLDTLREVATSFSFGFCVNVCVWRQSGEVELLKCSV